MDNEREKLRVLRALVVSSPGGINLRTLANDFNDEVDSSMKMGLRPLEELIRSHSEEFELRGDSVFAVQTGDSKHLQELVDQQQKKKTRPGKLAPLRQPRIPSFNGQRPRFQTTYPSTKTSKPAVSRKREGRIPALQEITKPASFSENSSSHELRVKRDPQIQRIVEIKPRKEEQQLYDPPMLRENNSKPSLEHRVETRLLPKSLMIERTIYCETANQPPRVQESTGRHASEVQNRIPAVNGGSSLENNCVNSYQEEESDSQNRYHSKTSKFANGDESDDEEGLVFKNIPKFVPSVSKPESIARLDLNTPPAMSQSIPSLISLSFPQTVLNPLNPLLANDLPGVPAVKSSTPMLSSIPPHISTVAPPVVPIENSFKSTSCPAPKRLIAERLASQFSKKERPIQEKGKTPSNTSVCSVKHGCLMELCRLNGLPEPETVFITKKNGDATSYKCLVKIGKYSFVTDGEDPDSETAKRNGLKKAYEGLSKNPSLVQLSSTDKFLCRVKELIEAVPSKAVWLSSIKDRYIEGRFDDPPPDDWEEAVINYHCFETTMYPSGRVISLKVSSTVRPPPGFDKKQKSIPELRPSPDLVHVEPSTIDTLLPISNKKTAAKKTCDPEIFASDWKAPVALPESPTPRSLPVLECPQEKFWELQILSALSLRERMVRFSSSPYVEALEDLLINLDLDMSENPVNPLVDAPVVGEIYAANNGESWFRGELCSIQPENKFEVTNIDTGGVEIITKENLCRLHDSLFALAPQAFRISLLGLENFPQMENWKDTVIEPSLCCFEPYEEINCEKGRCFSGILWDTRTDDDINCNLAIMEKCVSELPAPVLRKSASNSVKKVSHIDEFVHLQDPNSSLAMDSFIEYCWKLASDDRKKVPERIAVDAIYLTRNPLNGKMQRARLKEITNDPATVCVYFIDVGSTSEVAKASLYLASRVCLQLNGIPPLSINVILDQVGELNKQAQKAVAKIIPLGTNVVVKVINDESSVPSVTLHYREQCAGSEKAMRTMHCVNQMINKNAAVKVVEVDSEVTADHGIPLRSLPQVGDTIYIIPSLVVNPSHFYVQFLETYEELQQLMDALQEVGLSSLEVPKKLNSGSYYAVRSSDIWFRAKFLNAEGEHASFELVDLGGLTTVSRENVRELPADFMVFPKQAVRASLAGVVPINGDWLPEDCIHFKEMVTKELAAFVQGVSFEGGITPILDLNLVDTSHPDIDVVLMKCLVDLNIAKFKIEE